MDNDTDASVDGETGETGAMTSFNLDDISSSSEEEQDGDDDEDGDQEQDDNDDDRRFEGATQANVFAEVRDEGAVDAMVEEQIVRLDKQDQTARKGRGAAGQAELKRAREALRCARDCSVSSAFSPCLVLLASLIRSLVCVYICMPKASTVGNVTWFDCPAHGRLYNAKKTVSCVTLTGIAWAYSPELVLRRRVQRDRRTSCDPRTQGRFVSRVVTVSWQHLTSRRILCSVFV